MSNRIRSIFMAAVLVLFAGCGTFVRSYDEAKYKSITNEVGTVQVYSGGRLVAEYPGAKVLYSAADSGSMFIQFEGRTIYIQSDCLVMEVVK